MKTPLRFAAKLAVVLVAAVAVRCSDKCTVTNIYYYTEPTFMSFEELRSSVAAEEPRDLVNTGKIYFKDNFLYINERNEGVHVIDNRDPSNPVHRSFITIPGAYDLVVYGQTLYADSYVDLVAIDISVPGEEREIARYKDMFNFYSPAAFTANSEKGVITGMSLVETVRVDDDCGLTWQEAGWTMYESGYLMTADTYAAASSNKATPASILPGSSAGIGGSMARFTIASDRLYALDHFNLKVIDITNASNITLKSTVPVSSDVETIFPHGQSLFLGSQTGMHIFDISNAEDPKQISTFWHVKSCDPVVVEGDHAYVTLRTETICNSNINELQVIDVSDLMQPRHLSTYQMTNPHGLGIDNNTLFVCDGSDGLKIYDATDKSRISSNLKAHYKDIQAFDIIPFNDVAMMIGEDGLYQYDYSDLQNIRLLSKLEIKQQE